MCAPQPALQPAACLCRCMLVLLQVASQHLARRLPAVAPSSLAPLEKLPLPLLLHSQQQQCQLQRLCRLLLRWWWLVRLLPRRAAKQHAPQCRRRLRLLHQAARRLRLLPRCVPVTL